MTRRTQRERDLDLIAKAGPWATFGSNVMPSKYYGIDGKSAWSGADAACALQRETARIARERRGKGRAK